MKISHPGQKPKKNIGYIIRLHAKSVNSFSAHENHSALTTNWQPYQTDDCFTAGRPGIYRRGPLTPIRSNGDSLDGRDFSKPSDRELTEFRRNYIGYIFQSYNLMPNLSALENLQFIAEISKDPMDPKQALELVRLSDRADNFPSQMSGGQQQRVSIARALTKNPRLILADEPTAALDYETSIEVLEIVEEIVRNRGKTVVMITHNPEIAKMADRVVKLRGGVVSSIRINTRPLKARELVW